jgi:acyl-CoA reductase-like NAD-dependent aldehyde dehydrogenase
MLRSPTVDLDRYTQLAELGHHAVAALTLDERLLRIEAAAKRLADHADEIVELEVREIGVPRRFALREMQSALLFLEHLHEFAEEIRPRTVPSTTGTTRLSFEPYGVVFGWHAANAPILVPVIVGASAVVAGNALISRPSRRASRTTRRVLKVMSGVLPEHALQILDDEIAPQDAESFISHPGVHAVIAHASTATCKRHLARLGAAYLDGALLRPYIPEASGNDAFVVLEGADLSRAATALAVAAFANGGQLCMSAKRIICETAIWDEFRPLLVEATRNLVLGDPTHIDTDIAPLPEGEPRRRARAMLAEALAFGGEIIAGVGEDGPFFTPTIVRLPIEAVDAELWSDECFAPLRGLIVADGAKEAARLARESRYGLGIAVFGPRKTAEALARAVRTARVMINADPLTQDPHLVVGGVAESGVLGARPKLEQLVFARRIHDASD